MNTSTQYIYKIDDISTIDNIIVTPKATLISCQRHTASSSSSSNSDRGNNYHDETKQVISFYPLSQEFTSSSLAPTSSFIAKSSSSLSNYSYNCQYKFELHISGTNANEYSSSFANIAILALNSPRPAPILISAKFSDTGNAITVTFDSPTNKGKIKTSSFLCSDLFMFIGSSYSKCSWISSSIVIISFINPSIYE